MLSLLLTVGVWQWLAYEQRQSIRTEFSLEAEQRSEGIKRQFASEIGIATALQGLLSRLGRRRAGRVPRLLQGVPGQHLQHRLRRGGSRTCPPPSAPPGRRKGARGDRRGIPVHRMVAAGDAEARRSARRLLPRLLLGVALGASPEAFGFDWGSDPSARAALERRPRHGPGERPPPRVRLPGAFDEDPGWRCSRPSTTNNAEIVTLDQRRANLKGFVVAVIRIGDVIQDAIDLMPNEGVNLYLLDSTARPPDKRVLLSILAPTVPNGRAARSARPARRRTTTSITQARWSSATGCSPSTPRRPTPTGASAGRPPDRSSPSPAASASPSSWSPI